MLCLVVCVSMYVLGVLSSHRLFFAICIFCCCCQIFFIVAVKYFRYILNVGLNGHATHAAAFFLCACVFKYARGYVSVGAKCKLSLLPVDILYNFLCLYFNTSAG